MKKLVTNYIFNASFQLLIVLVPFITTPYIARVLGPDNLGVYAYSYSIIQILMVIGMVGIPLYGSRQIAAVFATKKDGISDEFWSIYAIQLIMTFLCMIFYIFYSFSLPSYLQRISLLQGINLFVFMFDISWFLLGLQQIKQTVIRNFIVKIISVILIFVCVKDDNDIGLYIVILSFSALIGQIFIWIYAKKYINFKLKLKWFTFSRHLKPLFILFLPQIIGQLYLSLDKIILNYFSTEVEVGFYDQAMKIVKLVTTLVTSLGAVVLPSIATEFAKGDIEKIQLYVKVILRYILLVTIPMTVGLACISDSFVILFLGEEFIKVGTILKIISPTILFIGLGSLFGVQILAGINQSNKLTISIVFGAITSLLINILLVPRYGMYATAFATLLTEVVVAFVQLYFVKSFFVYKEIKASLIMYIISASIMMVVIMLINYFIHPILLKIILQLLIGVIIYFIVLFLLKEEFIKQVIEQIVLLIKNYFKKENKIKN